MTHIVLAAAMTSMHTRHLRPCYVTVLLHDAKCWWAITSEIASLVCAYALIGGLWCCCRSLRWRTLVAAVTLSACCQTSCATALMMRRQTSSPLYSARSATIIARANTCSITVVLSTIGIRDERCHHPMCYCCRAVGCVRLLRTSVEQSREYAACSSNVV